MVPLSLSMSLRFLLHVHSFIYSDVCLYVLAFTVFFVYYQIQLTILIHALVLLCLMVTTMQNGYRDNRKCSKMSNKFLDEYNTDYFSPG